MVVKTLIPMLRYLTRKRAILFGLLILSANRTWNYYDKLIEQISAKQTVSQPTLIQFIILLGITCFILGYFICLELNVKEESVKKAKQ
jgi:hypothetical protein